jgi:hypothetical protein
MEKERTREHVLRDIGTASVLKFFAQAGWAAFKVDPDQDYGEDLVVEPAKDGTMTKVRFYVQVKARTKVGAALAKHASYKLRIATRDILRWYTSVDPVLIILWDVEQDRGYFKIIQDSITPQVLTTISKRKSIGVDFAKNNLLDTEALALILDYCESWRTTVSSILTGESFVISQVESKQVDRFIMDMMEHAGIIEIDGDGYHLTLDAATFIAVGIVLIYKEVPDKDAAFYASAMAILTALLFFDTRLNKKEVSESSLKVMWNVITNCIDADSIDRILHHGPGETAFDDSLLQHQEPTMKPRHLGLTSLL